MPLSEIGAIRTLLTSKPRPMWNAKLEDGRRVLADAGAFMRRHFS